MVALVVASRAAAQEPAALKAVKEQERLLYESATAEYRLGYFDKAAKLYEEAYRAFPDPALLYNIGQAQRQAGHLDKALVAYRSYVRTSPPDAANVDLARKRIEELGGTFASSTADGPRVHPSFQTAASASTRSAMPVAANLLDTTTPSERSSKGRWWIWSAAGVLVAGSIVATLLIVNRSADPTSGSVGTAVLP